MGLGIKRSGSTTEVGTVDQFPFASPPPGWLVCDGSTISRTTYAALFAKLGTTWGAGDGATTFAIPDMRGEFPRGLDNGRGVDAGRVLGTAQKGSLLVGNDNGDGQVHAFQGVAANREGLGWDPANPANYTGGAVYANPAYSDGFLFSADHYGTARARNVAMLFCIKF